MRDTPTSTRRSDEISFVMNAKPCRSRSWNSGIDPDAVDAADDGVAAAGRRAACGRRARPPSTTIDRVHALLLDLDPLAADAHGASGGWSSSRSRRARSRRGRRRRAWRPRRRRCGSRARPVPRAPRSSAAGVVRRRSASRRTTARRCVRPMLNFSTSNDASCLTTVSKIDVQELRVDQVAFGLDHLGDGVVGCQWVIA